MAEFLRCTGYLCYEAARAAADVSECPPHALVTRAGEVVGEGRGLVGCTIDITCSEFHKRRNIDLFAFRLCGFRV